MNAKRRRQPERWKNNNRSNQQKSNFARVAHFLCTFLGRCFARLQRETSRNFIVTLCVVRVLVHCFFHWAPLIFTLHWWPLAFLMLSPPLQKFHVVLPKKKFPFFLILFNFTFFIFFISRSRSLSPFLSLSFAGLPPTFSSQ